MSKKEREEAEGLGCKVVSGKGTTMPLHLSIVSPYNKRKRPVGCAGLYTQRDTHWSIIDNKDLFRMELGTFTGSGNPNYIRHRIIDDQIDRHSRKSTGILRRLFRLDRPKRFEISRHVPVRP